MTPSEKETLKRLAASAGQNVSTYVLSRALPSAERDLSRIVDELRTTTDQRAALGSLARFLGDLEPQALAVALGDVNLSGLSALAQNRVAGLVEDLSEARGIDAPAWALAIPPLPRPSFRWTLSSLRALQLRATRVAYRRRNVFDPALAVPRTASSSAPPELLQLNEDLTLLELDVEFYFIGGAVFRQLLPASLESARPNRLLVSRAPTPDLIADLAAKHGWAATRLGEVARTVVGQGRAPGRFLELSHVRVFAPPPDYALTMRLATLDHEPPPRVLDDLRLLLRLLDVGTAEEAIEVTGRYLSARHLPAHAIDTVRGLLG